MTSVILPSTVELPFSAILVLSQECWRLRRVAASLKNQGEGLAVNHAIRQISAILAEECIGIEDYSGRAYDPGMAPEVLDVIEDPAMAPGSSRIDETVSPTVTWKGQVAMQGQIIIRQSPATSKAATEENK